MVDMVFLGFIGFLDLLPAWKVLLRGQKSSPKDFLSVVVLYAFFFSVYVFFVYWGFLLSSLLLKGRGFSQGFSEGVFGIGGHPTSCTLSLFCCSGSVAQTETHPRP